MCFQLNDLYCTMAAEMMMFVGDDFLTIVDGMVACGVDHDALFQDKTQAQHLATDTFGNQFSACLDVKFKELDEHFKTYNDLTAAQGCIQIHPGVRKKHQGLCAVDTRRVASRL